MISKIDSFIDSLSSSKPMPSVLVVGDLMLDDYIFGDVNRVSPEAPVPVLNTIKNETRLGGSGNVAANLSGLKINTTLIATVGHDTNAELARSLLERANIKHNLVQLLDRPTTTKTRIVSGNNQIVRIDREVKKIIGTDDERNVLNIFNDVIKSNDIDVIILSDYGKGLITEFVASEIIRISKTVDVPVLVDPKCNTYHKYSGAKLVTPNQKEAAEICGCNISDIENIYNTSRRLMNELNIENFMVTRGENGISLIEDDDITEFSAAAKQVYDVSGAGDTVIATVAASLSLGFSLSDSCTFANLTAAIVVAKSGTVAVKLEDIILNLRENDAPHSQRITSNVDLAYRQCEAWRSSGEKIVFTNGCFDILHPGHVKYLENAKRLGDKLIVGLNSDSSVRQLKGNNRPINDENSRSLVLDALRFIDFVIIFPEKTPEHLIKVLKPDILVKGGDYLPKNIVGGDFVKEAGGEVKVLEFLQGFSTTSIINKILAKCT